jgi:hypothetical protein
VPPKYYDENVGPSVRPTSNPQYCGQASVFRGLQSAICGQGYGHFEGSKSAIFRTDIWGSFRGPGAYLNNSLHIHLRSITSSYDGDQ